MSAESLPKPHRKDASESVWYRLVLLFFVVYLTRFWFISGPGNPWNALAVAWGTCSLEPVVAFPLMRRLSRQRFRVPTGERVLNRIVGVGVFNWLLDVFGWNYLIRRMREFSGTKAGLRSLEQHARAGAIAHGACFAVTWASPTVNPQSDRTGRRIVSV